MMAGLAGMALALACLWWSWYYPARLVDADWYGTWMSRLFLYLIPSFALLGLWVAIDSFLDGIGLPMPAGLFDGGAVLLFLTLLLGIAGAAGVPWPAPWAPAWMRERRARAVLDRRSRAAAGRRSRDEGRRAENG
ncbi:hypothetical protein [Citricoccus nitrophenolicus]|uniref:hypothetical protein n=1 Tax=Citricoccus nitrophenolicus TaxID=863575 RepID=UPI0031EBAA41